MPIIRPTSSTGRPSCVVHVTVGIGVPSATQFTVTPVELVKCTCLGGSWENTGPWVALPTPHTGGERGRTC